MADDSHRFTAEGMRLTAVTLAQSADARAWNSWRQETDLLGDHQRTRINLSVTNLRDADLSQFNLVNVSFYRTDLSGAQLSGADCAHADFNQTKLIGANLSRANFSRARLSRAYLRSANLDYADLRRADLRRASLTSASLVGCRIEGVDLTSTRGLTQEQLVDARGDRSTRLPVHLIPPEGWVRFETDRDDEDEDTIDDLRIIPSSVEVAVVGDRLQLTRKPGDAYFAATSDPAALRDDILLDVDLITPRCGNLPLLARALKSYAEEFSRKDYDVIMVGVRGLRVQSVFEAVASDSSDERPELVAEAMGSVRAILIQHFLFISQSHRWKQFLEEASLAPYSNEDKSVARKAGEEVIGVMEANGAACDARVPKAIDAVVRELAVTDDAQRLATFNVIASLENAFKGVTMWIVKEAKRFLGTAWTSFSENLAKIVGASMATLASGLFLTEAASFLATAYPERFAWLRHAIELIQGHSAGK